MDRNTYLVVLNHTMDDLPIFLTEFRTLAMERALRVRDEELTEIKRLLGTDASTPVCTSIITFSATGEVLGREVIKEF